MFTRVVEVNVKPGKAKELARILQEKVLPILKQQAGFLDEIVLISTIEPDRVLTLSFWKEPANADRYHRQEFPKITEMLMPLVTATPTVHTYSVDLSTPHKVALGVAA